MLYISGHETLVIIAVLILITVGPPVAAWVMAMVQRWKDRKKKKQA